ncbi:MAG TPA: hypothetical protein VFE41_03985 [Acetobacteraceae bacterium]|jgi:succinoglycan biosynthesis protein ExoV|nr:hypothetical protein [Acetobacteraceae bacterium]
MQLYVWRGATRNFGDELNDLLWPHVLPGLLDSAFGAAHPDAKHLSGDGGPDLSLGIGSVLDARHPADWRKIVAGAGFGGYEASAVLDGSWEIYWVCGPRTARQLGLPAAFGLGDPASLLPFVRPPTRHEGRTSELDVPGIGTSRIGVVGFMPHFASLTRRA